MKKFTYKSMEWIDEAVPGCHPRAADEQKECGRTAHDPRAFRNTNAMDYEK
jgi:hypothetical protein